MSGINFIVFGDDVIPNFIIDNGFGPRPHVVHASWFYLSVYVQKGGLRWKVERQVIIDGPWKEQAGIEASPILFLKKEAWISTFQKFKK